MLQTGTSRKQEKIWQNSSLGSSGDKQEVRIGSLQVTFASHKEWMSKAIWDIAIYTD